MDLISGKTHFILNFITLPSFILSDSLLGLDTDKILPFLHCIYNGITFLTFTKKIFPSSFFGRSSKKVFFFLGRCGNENITKGLLKMNVRLLLHGLGFIFDFSKFYFEMRIVMHFWCYVFVNEECLEGLKWRGWLSMSWGWVSYYKKG